MQQATYIFIILICSGLYTNAQSDTLHRKEVRKYVIRYNENSDSLGKLNWLDTYDINGNLIQQIMYVEGFESCKETDAAYLSKSYAKYDKWNQMTEVITFRCNETFPVEKTTYVYTRNKENQVIEKRKVTINQYSLNDEPIISSYSSKYFYTEFNELKCEIESFGRKSTYLYDKNNNCTYVFSKTNYRSKLDVHHYKYDQHGNCISYEFKGERSCHLDVRSWKKSYNSKNQVTYQERCNGAGCSESKNEYDAKGRLKKRILDYKIEEFRYNTNGDLAETISRNPNGKIYEVCYYTYVYYPRE
jgi:hypothetical protein